MHSLVYSYSATALGCKHGRTRKAQQKDNRKHLRKNRVLACAKRAVRLSALEVDCHVLGVGDNKALVTLEMRIRLRINHPVDIARRQLRKQEITQRKKGWSQATYRLAVAGENQV